ncbi:MAG: endonuclease V [Endomicrobiia bacterium]
MISLLEATRIQEELSNKISLKCVFSSLKEIKTIAGCDVSYDDNIVKASVVLFSFPELTILEKIKIQKLLKEVFPYIPGYLSFREGPLLIECIKKLKNKPDVTLFDGQGIAHPRKIGIAAHVGVLLDIPTIGCAKNLLYGIYEEPPTQVKGAYNYLKDPSGEIIGIVLRTREFVKPIFVSPGHKIDIEMSKDLVLACCRKYRIPEPLRIAHKVSKE